MLLNLRGKQEKKIKILNKSKTLVFNKILFITLIKNRRKKL